MQWLRHVRKALSCCLHVHLYAGRYNVCMFKDAHSVPVAYRMYITVRPRHQSHSWPLRILFFLVGQRVEICVAIDNSRQSRTSSAENYHSRWSSLTCPCLLFPCAASLTVTLASGLSANTGATMLMTAHVTYALETLGRAGARHRRTHQRMKSNRNPMSKNHNERVKGTSGEPSA